MAVTVQRILDIAENTVGEDCTHILDIGDNYEGCAPIPGIDHDA